MLHDEPGWAEKLRVEPFNFRSTKRLGRRLAGCQGDRLSKHPVGALPKTRTSSARNSGEPRLTYRSA